MANTHQQSRAADFAQDTAFTMTLLQTAIRNALGFQVGGAEKIRIIQERFGLNFPLSWKLYRIVHSENALDASPHVPVAMAMKRVSAALGRCGVSAELIAALLAAFEAFERHVERFGGDRATFDGMVAQLAGGETEREVELEHRKSLFESERFIGKIEQDLFHLAQVIYPSPDNTSQRDVLSLRVYRDMRRLDATRRFAIHSRRTMPKPPGVGRSTEILPIDPAAFTKYGVPLLPHFCSTTHLQLKTIDSSTGYAKTYWMSESIGQPSTVSLSLGEIYKHFQTRAEASYSHYVVFSLPTKAYVFDLLVHRDSIPSMTQKTTRWRNPIEAREPSAGTEEALEEGGFVQLPCKEQLTYLGNASGAVQMADAPRYDAMLKFALSHTPYKLEEFSLYRLRMEYPLMYSMLLSRCTFAQ